jgi:hypothetical protein
MESSAECTTTTTATQLTVSQGANPMVKESTEGQMRTENSESPSSEANDSPFNSPSISNWEGIYPKFSRNFFILFTFFLLLGPIFAIERIPIPK